MIVDICQLGICIVCGVVMHMVLKKSFGQKVEMLKALSIIDEEEIYRIQKNLNDHREQIKNN